MSECREFQEKYNRLISDRLRFKAIGRRQKPRTEILELKDNIAKSLREFRETEYEFGDAKVKILPTVLDYTKIPGSDVEIDNRILIDYEQVLEPVKNPERDIEKRIIFLTKFPDDEFPTKESIKAFMQKYNLRFAYLREILTCFDQHHIGGNKNGVVSFLDNDNIRFGVILRNKTKAKLVYFGQPYALMNEAMYLFVKR